MKTNKNRITRRQYTNGTSRVAREQRILWSVMRGADRHERSGNRTKDEDEGVPTLEDFVAFEDAVACEGEEEHDDDGEPLSVTSFFQRSLAE